jgi:septum formation protein
VKQRPTIILASASPRRRDLLRGIGLEFAVQAANIDESLEPGELPQVYVERLSKTKAAVVAKHHPEALVIAADTTVVLDGDILEKPKDLEQNRSFIERLAGRSHEVFSGHALRYQGQQIVVVKRSLVFFRALSEREISCYVATGEGLDKAGGYAIQGRGAALIPHIEGCYFNIMGLSLAAVVEAAKQLGVELA